MTTLVKTLYNSTNESHFSVPSSFQHLKDRINSFKRSNWPSHLLAQPNDLARAGFYFFKKPDKVKCVYCKGCLKNWQISDTPSEQHKLHFPHCTFLSNIEQEIREVLKTKCNTRSLTSKLQSPEDLRQEMSKTKECYLWRTVLLKIGYSRALILSAENVLKSENKIPDLHSVLTKAQTLDYEHFVGNLDAMQDEVNDEMWSCGVVQSINVTEEVVKTMLCKLCMEMKLDTLFLPCRHLAACQRCTSKVTVCPVCRKFIDYTVSVFVC